MHRKACRRSRRSAGRSFRGGERMAPPPPLGEVGDAPTTPGNIRDRARWGDTPHAPRQGSAPAPPGLGGWGGPSSRGVWFKRRESGGTPPAPRQERAPAPPERATVASLIRVG